MLVFERQVVAGQVELADDLTVQTKVLFVAPPRGPPMDSLDILGIKDDQDHVLPIGLHKSYALSCPRSL